MAPDQFRVRSEEGRAPQHIDRFWVKLELIRQTGAANMLNRAAVEDTARQLGFDDMADWIGSYDGRQRYGSVVTAEFVPVFEDEDVEASYDDDSGLTTIQPGSDGAEIEVESRHYPDVVEL